VKKVDMMAGCQEGRSPSMLAAKCSIDVNLSFFLFRTIW